MKRGVYYWQAADRWVFISCGRMINILSENKYGVHYMDVEKCRSRTANLKTLIYLGDL